MNQKNIPDIIKRLPLYDIERIDTSLEGDWSPNVKTIWSKDKGFFGFPNVKFIHSTFKPSLELYFESCWFGIHCFKKVNNQLVLDEEYALNIIQYINNMLNK